MDTSEKRSVIEALLFISGEPVTPSSLKAVIETDENEIKSLMGDIMAEYNSRDGGVIIKEVAGGFQMLTHPRNAPWVKKFLGVAASSRLSAAALETLAVVAYKQPLIKAEIEQIRGVNSDGVLKTLLDKRMIKIVGKKEAPGKPMLYGTTKEFLQYFGLKDLTDLPALKDFSREETI